MNIARFIYNNKIYYGALKSEKLQIIKNSIFDSKIDLADKFIDLKQARLLAPVVPAKIICVGLNYKDHAAELGMAMPEEPVIFLKPPTAVIGPDDNIIWPPGVSRLDYEAELAVVIKCEAKDIPEKEASNYILGYTCLNDITARDLQKKDGQWTRAKSFDTFCPIGPCITTGLNPSNLNIRLAVNGVIKQSSNTSDLIFHVFFLVSFISSIMTLSPGDIIATGTPKGVGPLNKGDKVEIDIEGIGALKNIIN